MAQLQPYEAAMREAASAAWDQNWRAAIRAYQQALEAAPDDPQALAGLALSLYEAGEDEHALQAYTRLARLVPSDPLPREKLGEIHRRAGNAELAAKQFMAAGEIYFARKDLQRATANWEQAVRLDLDLAQAHMRLATVYEKDASRTSLAVTEYLHVARLLQQMQQPLRAEQALKRALRLDPINVEVRTALGDLRLNKPIQMPGPYSDALFDAGQSRQISPDELPTVEEELLEAAEKPREYSPIEVAVRHAMGLLADSIWSGEVPPEAQAPLLAALDAHQLGDADAALQNYSRARKAGLNHPALHFNLGVVLCTMGEYRPAADLLADTVQYEEYRLAGHLLLGRTYQTQGDERTAAHHMLLAMQAADHLLNPGLVDEKGYERALASLPDQTDDHLADITRAIAFYLDDADWRSKLTKALSNYVGQGKINYVPDLLDLMIEGGRPELAAIMERVDEYLQRNMLLLATEEIHHAIERAPDYLPAHRRLADALVREGRTQEAAAKLNLVASTYLVRGSAEKAADLFVEVINLWPADTLARRRVIDMLRQQRRTGEALHHYVELADTYYRLMADADRAVEIYREALDYSREANADPEQVIPVLRGLADVESQRLNWHRALQYYERIRQVHPEDEEVALSIVALHYQLGQPREAVRALDDVIREILQQGRGDRVTEILEGQVERHPQEAPLRQRLAEVYRQQGRMQEAITQLDALGELQLDAGRIEDAIATVQRIIDLNPPDADGYHQLLAQLRSGGYQP